MLEYDRINVSGDIDINKAIGWHECIICRYQYFLGISFRFPAKVCDGCYDMTQKSTSFSNFAIVTIRRNTCRFNTWVMSKSKAIHSMKNVHLNE